MLGIEDKVNINGIMEQIQDLSPTSKMPIQKKYCSSLRVKTSPQSIYQQSPIFAHGMDQLLES